VTTKYIVRNSTPNAMGLGVQNREEQVKSRTPPGFCVDVGAVVMLPSLSSFLSELTPRPPVHREEFDMVDKERAAAWCALFVWFKTATVTRVKNLCAWVKAKWIQCFKKSSKQSSNCTK
jgi:hypothetical protein